MKRSASDQLGNSVPYCSNPDFFGVFFFFFTALGVLAFVKKISLHWPYSFEEIHHMPCIAHAPTPPFCGYSSFKRKPTVLWLCMRYKGKLVFLSVFLRFLGFGLVVF